ncbi:MAG: YebC/PmpR family DNA-binding transcriptional regulator [bacterium]|nr:YebC/PmpR family DNA-binding transcriptional regulator [bacterium]
MAGHSHSANIKHRKNAVDAKRAKVFSKLARNIISAVRQGGEDTDTNLKLKYAVEKARAANMPKDNIERAIKRGAGDKDGDLEELIYEGYAPGGVALMIMCLTDNRNRTAPEVKYTLEHGAGNLGATGSVSFMFDFRSIFIIEMGERDEDTVMEIALEAGADDVLVEGDVATIFAEATDFLTVKGALEGKGLELLQAETGYVPQNTVKVESEADAKKILKLIENLEDNEDVQSVYANFDIPDEWIEAHQS